MSQALQGIRILDMTHVQAGPTCSQLLAWMGADVIKFEPPQGDATRGQLRDVPGADSLYFTMLNCNKRSITVNMKSAEGKQVFVVADAVSSRGEANRDYGLQRMRDAGAVLVTREMVLFECLRVSGNDLFRRMSKCYLVGEQP